MSIYPKSTLHVSRWALSCYRCPMNQRGERVSSPQSVTWTQNTSVVETLYYKNRSLFHTRSIDTHETRPIIAGMSVTRHYSRFQWKMPVPVRWIAVLARIRRSFGCILTPFFSCCLVVVLVAPSVSFFVACALALAWTFVFFVLFITHMFPEFF